MVSLNLLHHIISIFFKITLQQIISIFVLILINKQLVSNIGATNFALNHSIFLIPAIALLGIKNLERLNTIALFPGFTRSLRFVLCS